MEEKYQSLLSKIADFFFFEEIFWVKLRMEKIFRPLFLIGVQIFSFSDESMSFDIHDFLSLNIYFFHDFFKICKLAYLVKHAVVYWQI